MVRNIRGRLGAGILLVMVAFGVTAGFVMPAPTHAQVPVAANTVNDTPRTISEILEDVARGLKDVLIQSVATVLINTASYAADRLAYDAAVYIAAGGNGDAPLFENRSVGEYFADYGADVAGEAIGLIDEEHLLGDFSLCSPGVGDANVMLAFKFGLKGAFQREEPRCEFNEIRENWEGFVADIASSTADPTEKNQLVLTELANAYNSKENDFSVGITLYSDVLNKAHQKQFLETQKLMMQGFFKDKTDFITGKVETPGDILQKNFTQRLQQPEETRRDLTIATLGGDENLLLQLGMHAGSVFTNTLLSEFTQRMYDGLFTFDSVDTDPFDPDDFAEYNAQDARDSYRSFLAAAPLEITNYSILSEFSACPYEGRGLYNCVADTSFVSAIARSDAGAPLTIEEAIEEGLLNGSWALVPSSDKARNQDPYCYTYGYCHTNLVKLRKARVISIGWELAAESPANTEADPATLEEVVNGFHDCNAQGELDDAHPWCHLIDPTWVLKYPDTQCRAQVYGQMLEASVSDQRMEECVDMPSCIAEDANGTCTGGYGYCVREENVWQFRGESCPDYYATCTDFEDPSGDDFAFLTNTVTSGECDESNAGCLWYSTVQEEGDDGFDWPDYSTSTLFAAAEVADNIYENRIYFTSAIEECDESDAGCRELVRRDETLSLNMITNPGFEDDEDANGVPDGWFNGWFGAFVALESEYSSDDTYALSGDAAVSPGNSTGLGAFYQTGLVLSQGTNYTLSFYARQSDTEYPDYVDAAFVLTEGQGEDTDGDGDLDSVPVDIQGIEVEGDCSGQYVDIFGTTKTDGFGFSELMPGYEAETGTASSDYERYTCTFSVPTLEDPALDVIGTFAFTATTVYIDNIQLEQDAEASDYHEGYSDTALDLAYVKVPPSYLGCTGSDSDPEECDDYAAVCEEQDVGCSAYTPTNGDPTVTGVANALDECPSTCEGYDTFKQEPTLYEPEGDFPVYFIPETGTECTDEEVGCDEFTNESTEALEYFTYLRACVTSVQALANINDDQAATFYTWEGSDLDGYQLVTWTLLESDLGSTTYTYASGETDPEPGAAPCTTWETTPEGIQCTDDADGDGDFDADTEDCDEHSDIFMNPDCREFYDASGNIHYREWSKTVTVDDACVTYRKTEIVGATTADQQANCEESGGYFDTTSGICRYYGFADESSTCDEQASGCREYTGGRSRNSRVAFEDLFENDTLGNWDSASSTAVTLSNESIATDGHSLASVGEDVWTFIGDYGKVCEAEDGCGDMSGQIGATCEIQDGEQYCGTLHDELYEGKTYTLSFWAKGTGDIAVGFDSLADATNIAIDISLNDEVVLEEGWNEYQVGPIDSADYDDFGDGTVLVFAPIDSSTTFYIDNIVLREGEDNITLIKDSWVTPAQCDETPEGTASPQYYLGCAEYTDQEGDLAYLKSFSSLCNESQVGCEAFYMTQESDDTGAKVYGAVCENLDADADGTADVVTSPVDCYYELDSTGTAFDTSSQFLCTIGLGESECEFDLDWYVDPISLSDHVSYGASTTIVPADRDVFLVVNDSVECSSDVAGCAELGLPEFAQDHTYVAEWESVYLINDPESYADTLCAADELFCEEYTTTEGERWYFKNPQDQTCEYRTDVTVAGVTYDGWFKTDTNELCYDDYIVGGDYANVWRNGDSGYQGWVATCESKYDSCSEFQDLTDLPEDEVYGNSDGESYYYLNNENLEENTLPDSQRCDGQVSQKEGCALFNDTSETSQLYSMSATYTTSIHADDIYGDAPDALVDPIDCEAGNTAITLSDGSTFDPCDMRCGYDTGALFDLSDPSATSTTFDGSCYANADCRPITSEAGETVQGSCMSATDNGGDRLQNDANTVLKVDRDRQCSEWLSCSDMQTVWDERTNSFRTVCGDVELCTDYSSTGSASFCSDWKFDDVATILDTDKYTTRDVSWYGEEYSGYAVPDLFPVQMLTQVNISDPADTEAEDDYRLAYVAGQCAETAEHGDSCTVGYCENTGTACASTDQCGSGGGDCIVGACYAVSTTSCASDNDCSTGQSCLGGVCAAESTTVIPTVEDYVASPTNACGSSLTFYPAAATKTGSCMRGSCVLTPTGETFAEDESEEMICRGYPEIDSPFSTDVVTEWRSPSDETTFADPTNKPGAVPYAMVNGFSQAEVCAPNEACDCSYKKTSFGDSIIKYYALDSDFPYSSGTLGVCVGGDDDGAYCSDDSTLEPLATVVSLEQCEGVDGTEGQCVYPTEVNDVLGFEGYCLERDSGINVLGDRDKYACLTWLPVDQLVGSTDLYAKYTEAGYEGGETHYCADVRQYVDLKSSHVDFDLKNTSEAADDTPSSFGIACVEYNADSGRDPSVAEDREASCVTSNDVKCPPGYFAVVGKPNGNFDDTPGDDGDGYFAEACGVSVGDADCPLMCVPYGSFVRDTTNECTPPDETPTHTENHSAYIDGVLHWYPTDVYYMDSYSQFDDYVEGNYDCWALGREYVGVTHVFEPHSGDQGDGWYSFGTVRASSYGTRDDGSETFYMPISEMMQDSWWTSGGDSAGWYNLEFRDPLPYLSCKETMKVEDGDNTGDEGAPWTDRLLGRNTYTLEPDDSGEGSRDDSTDTYDVQTSKFLYTRDTAISPFGAVDMQPNDNDNRPPTVAHCYELVEGTSLQDLEVSFTPPTLEAGSFSCEEYEGSHSGDVNDPDARSFYDFYGSATPVTGYDSDITYYGMDSDRRGDFATSDSLNLGLLDQIFAKSVGLAKFFDGFAEVSDLENDVVNLENVGPDDISEGEMRELEGTELTDAGYLGQAWDARVTYGQPPEVFALDLGTCQGDECEEDEDHNLTLNDQNEGDVESNSFYRAYLKFYAAAFKEQLPIRRVIIDWGDDSGLDDQVGSASEDNFYKNHRGLQDGSSESICSRSSTNPTGYDWGETPESCDPYYFSYSHIYTCGSDVLTGTACSDSNGDGYYDSYPCQVNNTSCVFRPRVHILDNWGFCTGECTGGDDGDEDCFEGDVSALDEPSSQLVSSECAYQTYPDTYPTRGNDPWVYYEGEITVTP